MNGPADAGNCCDCLADQITVFGTGSPSDPFRTTPVPVGSPRQVFKVTRQGGDTDTIVINVARGFVARANALYGVQATMGANSLGVGIVGCDPANYLTTQFTFRLTSAWAAGDSVVFTVEDLT